jgi:hypothetical protein
MRIGRASLEAQAAPRAARLDCSPMAPLTPAQRRWRARIETLIRLAAPGLDLVLATGDRVARMIEGDDLDWVPPRKALGTDLRGRR